MTTHDNTISRSERISRLHVLLGQMSGIAWLMGDFGGDFETNPDDLRHTGLLIQRLGAEAKEHVEALELDLERTPEPTP